MTSDWFNYSVTTPTEARVSVSDQIYRHQEQIHKFFSRHAIDDVNLYITGSLSRQEPSVSVRDGRYSLLSDIDLIAVIKGGDSAGHPIRHLESQMNQIAPDVSTSLFSIRSTDLPSVTSMLGRDLWYTIQRPIVQTYGADTFPPPYIGQREKYEAFIHQLGSYLLYPEDSRSAENGLHFRTFRTVHEIKLILEGLRCLLEVSPDGLLRYREVYENRESDLVAAVLDPSDVWELFKRRELFDGSPLGWSIKKVMRRLVAAIFNIVSDAGDGAAVANSLADRLQGSSSIIDIYQMTTPMLLWIDDRPTGTQSEVREAFIRGWQNLDPRQLFAGADAYEEFLRVGKRAGEEPADRFRHFLADIRHDYYSNLRMFLFGYRRHLAYR